MCNFSVGRRELETYEDDTDPSYKAFLEKLRWDGNSYLLEADVDILRLNLKYEGDEISDGEFDSDKRILRSARKKTNVSSKRSQSTSPSEEAENSSRRKSSKRVKWETVIPNGVVEDSDYAAFLRGCKIVGDQCVYADGLVGENDESDPSKRSQSTSPSEEAGNSNRRKSRKRVKGESIIPNGNLIDPGYAAFMRGCQIVVDQPVCADGLITEIVEEHDELALSKRSQSTSLSEEPENSSRRKSRKRVKGESIIPNGNFDDDPGYAAFMRGCQPVYADGLNTKIVEEHEEWASSKRPQSTYLSEEAENSSRRKLRKRVKGETLLPNGIVDDPDYAAFLRKCEFVGDQPVYADGLNSKIERQDDEWAPYVEILDRDTFYKKGNVNSSVERPTDRSKNKSELRSQLIGVLRKPYDKVEYKRLLKEINSCKKEVHHKELRHGREKSLPTEKFGKSYLDHYPDLDKQLSELQYVGPKALNLLRGFFFWLEKASHDGIFKPWKDDECLDIIPGSG